MGKEHKGELRRQGPAPVDPPEGGVRVLESHHASNFEMETGAWPFHKICWVAVGRGALEHSSGSADIGRNDFLLLPANWAHRFVDHPGEPLTLVILCLGAAFLSGKTNRQLDALWRELLERYPPGEVLCARSAFHRSSLIDEFRTALREQGAPRLGWETSLEVVGSRLLLRFARGYCQVRGEHVESSQSTVAGAIEYMDARPYEALQITDMAERCGLSPRRFTDLFKEQSGQTFSNYLNRQRIHYACRRLDETGHILYACHESGFNDLAYFYRVFKKQTGLTPGAYLEAKTIRD